MKLRLSWNEFTEAAMKTIRADHPKANDPILMKEYGYEPDGEWYETPSYVLVNLEDSQS